MPLGGYAQAQEPESRRILYGSPQRDYDMIQGTSGNPGRVFRGPLKSKIACFGAVCISTSF
jgi:hypothetical protein